MSTIIDIVERLRTAAARTPANRNGGVLVQPDTLLEAAAEIERLRENGRSSDV